VWPWRAKTYLIKVLAAGRWPLGAGRSPPSMVVEASSIEGRRRRPGAASKYHADDALDEAKAVAQTGQYPRWRRRVNAGWLQDGPGEDTKRRMRTRAQTAHLYALTHFASTFGPGMGRTDRACLFGLGRSSGFSPFFYPRGCVRTCGVLLDALREEVMQGW
jgi:hypothetical protein